MIRWHLRRIYGHDPTPEPFLWDTSKFSLLQTSDSAEVELHVRNMASMDEGEKSYETIILIVKSNITNDWISH